MKTTIFKIFIGLMLMQILFVGCTDSTQNPSYPISQYYAKHDSYNDGELKILDNYQDNYQTYILAEKYNGEGEKIIDLFILNRKNTITHKASGARAISPCYSLYSVILNDKMIIFGDYKNEMWNPKNDTTINVNLKGIEIIFDNMTSVRKDFNKKDSFLIVTDTLMDIIEANVYDDKGTVSSLLDTSYSILNLININ